MPWQCLYSVAVFLAAGPVTWRRWNKWHGNDALAETQHCVLEELGWPGRPGCLCSATQQRRLAQRCLLPDGRCCLAPVKAGSWLLQVPWKNKWGKKQSQILESVKLQTNFQFFEMVKIIARKDFLQNTWLALSQLSSPDCWKIRRWPESGMERGNLFRLSMGFCVAERTR